MGFYEVFCYVCFCAHAKGGRLCSVPKETKCRQTYDVPSILTKKKKKKKLGFMVWLKGGAIFCYFLLFSAIFCYFGGLDFLYFLAVVWAFAKGKGNEGLLTPASPQNTYQRCRTTFFSSKKA